MRLKRGIITGALGCGIAAATAATLTTSGAAAHGGAGDPSTWNEVPAAPKVAGLTVPNAVSGQLRLHIAAQGSIPLDGGTAAVPYYGYDGDGPLLPPPGALPAPGTKIEATKTEPDKNTYLVLHGQKGADPAYNYGYHFLFQGHEAGTPGYLTRINLDADTAHRVTLMATTDVNGAALPTYDGSTWDPFARRLLLTAELGANGGVWQATLDYPSSVEDISAVTGRAGYEGVQNDSAGQVWLVEDVGGATISGTRVRIPNSFVYRFVPDDPSDLAKGGKLQALQVLSNATHEPITFQAIDAAHPNGNALSDDQKALHVYGSSFETRWVTVHDTETDTSGLPFDANALAKSAGATPFKRPENGVFRPGIGFTEFYFDETGDTNADSIANDEYGGWGSIFKLAQSSPTADSGTLSIVLKGDKAHTAFDNVSFLDGDNLGVVEDAGDTLHTQRGALDSGFVVDVTHDYSTGPAPVRFLAEGRDPSATLDSAFLAYAGFTNDGDNEITGIHASNGDPTPRGILGAKVPNLFRDGWRLFWTQQHGDNTTWEIVPS